MNELLTPKPPDPQSVWPDQSSATAHKLSLRGSKRRGNTNDNPCMEQSKLTGSSAEDSSAFVIADDKNDQTNWIRVPPSRKKQFLRNKKLGELVTNTSNSDPRKSPVHTSKLSSSKNKWHSPLYTEKLARKTTPYMNTTPADKPTDVSLSKHYEYCKKDFKVTNILRKPTAFEVEILQLMKERRLCLIQLPQFIYQIFSPKKVGQFETLLTRKFYRELFVQLAPGHRLNKALPDYAIRMNIHTSGEVPAEITKAIEMFKTDVEEVYFIAKRRFIVFSFASEAIANRWQGKYIPYQNKPLKLQPYFNNERHQALPLNDLGDKFDFKGKPKSEQLAMLRQIKTIVPYSMLLTNVSPLIKLRHIDILFREILHLSVGRINTVLNPLTGRKKTSTWEVTLTTEGMPEILDRKTCIQWDQYSVHIFHNTIHTSLPCTACCSAKHIYAVCPNKTNGHKFHEHILQLIEDEEAKELVEEPIPVLNDENEWDFLMQFQAKPDKEYNSHIASELNLHCYGLEFDIQNRIQNRVSNRLKTKKTQKSKRTKQKQHAYVIKQKKMRVLEQTTAQKDLAEQGLNMTFNALRSFLSKESDAFCSFVIADYLFMQPGSLHSLTAKSPPALTLPQIKQYTDPRIVATVLQACSLVLPSDDVDDFRGKSKSTIEDNATEPSSAYSKAQTPTSIVNNCEEERGSTFQKDSCVHDQVVQSSLPTSTTKAKSLNVLEKWLNKENHKDDEKKKSLHRVHMRPPAIESVKHKSLEIVKSSGKSAHDLSSTRSSNSSAELRRQTQLHLAVELRQILVDCRLQHTNIIGNGHCLWAALLVGNYNQALQSFPVLTAIEEDNVTEIKQSIADYVEIIMDDCLQNISVPLLNDAIEFARPGKLSRKQKRHHIQQYFDTITSTLSTTHLSPDYWGSSFSIEVASHVLHKIIYVISFDVGNATVGLQKLDFVGDFSKGSTEMVPAEDWLAVLGDTDEGCIILECEGQRHFSVYLQPVDVWGAELNVLDNAPTIETVTQGQKRISTVKSLTDDEESDSDSYAGAGMGKRSAQEGSSNAELQAQIEDGTGSESKVVESETERELSGFSDLSPITSNLARKDYMHIPIQDVEKAAEQWDISPPEADARLRDMCKVAAVKTRLEAQILSGIDIESSTNESVSEYNTPSGSEAPMASGSSDAHITLQQNRNNSGTTAEPESPASQVLMHKKIIDLLPDEVTQRKKKCLESLLHETWAWSIRHSKLNINMDVGKVLVRDAMSWKAFQKLGHMYPAFLLEVISESSSPVLFLRQMPPKTLLELGKSLISLHLLEYLSSLTKQLTIKRQLATLHGWLATVKIIKVIDARYNMLISPSQWGKLLKVYPGALEHWHSIQGNRQLPYVCLIDHLFPGSFHHLAHQTTYTGFNGPYEVYAIPDLWSLSGNQSGRHDCDRENDQT